jgi:hypothetical protein
MSLVLFEETYLILANSDLEGQRILPYDNIS